MAFNGNTYRANKARKAAWEYLAKAREIKDRFARGEAYDWERPRVVDLVEMARREMHLYLGWKRIASLGR